MVVIKALPSTELHALPRKSFITAVCFPVYHRADTADFVDRCP